MGTEHTTGEGRPNRVYRLYDVIAQFKSRQGKIDCSRLITRHLHTLPMGSASYLIRFRGPAMEFMQRMTPSGEAYNNAAPTPSAIDCTHAIAARISPA